MKSNEMFGGQFWGIEKNLERTNHIKRGVSSLDPTTETDCGF